MASFVRHGKKIVAIGRNYANHVKELGNTTPKEPFFFLKPTTSYLPSQPGAGAKVEIPRGVICHHEVELGFIIGKSGRDIAQADAEQYIAGYALAVDLTARNFQDQVKKKGLPWSAVKGFDGFTPIGSFIPKSLVKDPHDLRLWLKINDAFKQNGSTSSMIFPIPRLIEHISSIMTLEEGDLVLTGTPEGVGRIQAGDLVECGLEGSDGKELAKLEFNTVDRVGGYEFKAE